VLGTFHDMVVRIRLGRKREFSVVSKFIESFTVSHLVFFHRTFQICRTADMSLPRDPKHGPTFPITGAAHLVGLSSDDSKRFPRDQPARGNNFAIIPRQCWAGDKKTQEKLQT